MAIEIIDLNMESKEQKAIRMKEQKTKKEAKEQKYPIEGFSSNKEYFDWLLAFLQGDEKAVQRIFPNYKAPKK